MVRASNLLNLKADSRPLPSGQQNPKNKKKFDLNPFPQKKFDLNPFGEKFDLNPFAEKFDLNLLCRCNPFPLRILFLEKFDLNPFAKN